MTAATARAGVARRSVRRVRRVSIDRFLLSTLLAPSLCSRRPAPLDATRHPHVLPSLSLSPSPVPRPAVLRDFPRFLLSIRHGVIFPSCSRVAFFSFPSTTNLRDEATSETRKQRTIVSPFSLPRFDRRPFFPFFLSRTQRT